MDFAEIRRLVITALFSDDTLLDQLVLKGGNAVNLVYGFGSRGSIDVDFSLEGDFTNPEEAKNRILKALEGRFASVGFTLFDQSFEPRPSVTSDQADDRWGGYEVQFKFMETDGFQELRKDLGKARREALLVGPNQQRVFRIQISRFEYCAPKKESELDDYTIYVYTPEMLAIEKLRALCQQMPEYRKRAHPTPRARDFYDLYSILTEAKVDFSTVDCHDLVVFIFNAKDVPLRLIRRIPEYREFHRLDWPSVEMGVATGLKEFDFYFDFVADQIALLKSLWVE